MPRPKRAVPIDRYVVMTQAQVGAKLGLSAMRVSQLERSAFKKIRAAFKEQGYEIREPAIPKVNSALRFLAQREREEWMWRLLLTDCDTNDSPIARLWKAQ